MAGGELRFFLSGIMKGSQAATGLHAQDYRGQLASWIAEFFPGASIYDPLQVQVAAADDPDASRRAFFAHNRRCGDVDVLVAYVPEASMGTAIEMWEAHRHGVAVISISPLHRNWVIRFLSHAIYADLEQFRAALADGTLRQRIAEIAAQRRPAP